MGAFNILFLFIMTYSASQNGVEGARRVNLDHMRAKRSLHIRESSPDELFGLKAGEHLVPGNKFRTAAGTTKVKMQETYQGLPVVGEALVLEVDENGHYTGEISGQLLEDIEDDVPSITPMLSVDDAFHIALSKSQHTSGISFNPENDAVLQILVQGKQDIHATLVYKLNYRIETKSYTSRPTYIINANTGKVIKSWDAMSMSSWRKKHKRSQENEILKYKLVEGAGGNKKIGKHLYGLDLPELRVESYDNGTCALENQYAIVYNCDGNYGCLIENRTAYLFDCEQGSNDTVNGGYSPLNDALFYVGITYEMYADWYEISDPLKTKEKNGGRCWTRVHYGEGYENAFWDGKVITFGDGADVMYPLASLNVVAHEISHGFTEVNSGLEYRGESGGMNEAFSDMAGEAAEDYLRHKIDWMVGFDMWKAENESMRYFDDPTKDGKSIAHADDMCFLMDPHQSSGVYNKVFYILSNKPGWCVRKAFHVFLVANDIYWKPDSGFSDGACDAIKAAKDLGYSGDDVSDAFEAAGVTPCDPTQVNLFKGASAMANDSYLTIQLNNEYDTELDYTYVMIIAMGMPEPIEYTITTPSYIYSVKSSGEGRFPQFMPFINLGRQCFQKDCTVSIHAAYETNAMVIPVAFIETLIQGKDYSMNDSMYPAATNSSDPFYGRYFVDKIEFSLPKVITDNKMMAVLLATAGEGNGNFFISHKDPPKPESYEFDYQGPITRNDGSSTSPAIMCASKEGTYHMIIEMGAMGTTEGMKDVRVELFTWLEAKKVESDADGIPQENNDTTNNDTTNSDTTTEGYEPYLRDLRKLVYSRKRT